MTFNTGNAVPSKDPRDLNDNAQALDRFLMSLNSSEPDRLGQLRKTWHQMEADAAALVSPNVSALASAVAAVNKGFYFSGVSPVAISTYDLTSFFRSLGSAVDAAALRTAIGAMNVNDTGAYNGSAAKLTAARSIAATGDATWTVNFDGSGNVTAALTLANSGITAGTYDRVTVDAKGRATSGTNKPAWTNYTPTISATTGAFTTVTASGSYIVIAGICYYRVTITVTAKGTGAKPVFSLPQPALAGTTQAGQVFETPNNGKSGVAKVTTGLLTAQCSGADNLDLVTADGSILSVQGFYPIA